MKKVEKQEKNQKLTLRVKKVGRRKELEKQTDIRQRKESSNGALSKGGQKKQPISTARKSFKKKQKPGREKTGKETRLYEINLVKK